MSVSGCSQSEFLTLENSAINQFLILNGFPSTYTATSVKEDIGSKNTHQSALANYLGDANAALFDTGAEVYKISWEKTHEIALDNVYFTYGYYFDEIV